MQRTLGGCILFYSPFVEGLGIFAGVAEVLVVGLGEVVGAGEIFLGTHVVIVVVVVVEHSVYSLHRGNLYGAGREACVLVGVVGALYAEVFPVDASQGEVVEGKLYRGVGLKWHFLTKAVQVHAGNGGFLGVVGCLLIYYAGERGHLDGGEPHAVAQGKARGVPKGGVFTLHAVHEGVETYVPIHLIGVGNEEGGECEDVIAVAGHIGGIGEAVGYLEAVYHEVGGEIGG